MQQTFGSMLIRLRDSQLQLERANSAKQQFLRFVFHEVRVPLNAVSLGIEHLKTCLGQDLTHLIDNKDREKGTNAITATPHPAGSAAQSTMLSLSPREAKRAALPVLLNDSGASDFQVAVASNNEAMRETVYLMHEQINIITRILNDVLSLQRIEDGEMKLEMVGHGIYNMQHDTCSVHDMT
jgi:signal transduction histidine kinase